MIDLKKRYNIREGWTPSEDTLPRRFLSEPLAEGASDGALLPRERLETMVLAYNLARGWSPEGWIPAD